MSIQMNSQLRHGFCVGIALLLSACATAPFAPSEADERAKTFSAPAGKANIYLFRNEHMGALVAMKVMINGKVAGRTRPMSYFVWAVDPGTYEIASETENTSSVTVKAEAGKSYFIWQEVKMGFAVARNKVQLVDDETGRNAVKDCKLLESEWQPGK